MRPVLQQRFQLTVNPHAVAGQLVLAARHGPPQPLFGVGHEAEESVPRPTCRRRSRSASAKSRLRPCGARLECACARASSQWAFQLCHTGFQYCAVDSMTASRTAWRSSTPATPATRWPSCQTCAAGTENSPSRPASAITTASNTLVNVNPCYQITFHNRVPPFPPFGGGPPPRIFFFFPPPFPPKTTTKPGERGKQGEKKKKKRERYAPKGEPR